MDIACAGMDRVIGWSDREELDILHMLVKPETGLMRAGAAGQPGPPILDPSASRLSTAFVVITPDGRRNSILYI
jgi:hypothetical protein